MTPFRFDVVGQLPALRRYARALTRDDGDAEDLVHDALVRAYERRGTFAPGRDLKRWLLSIVHNAFIDRGRVRAAETRRLAELAAPVEIAADPAQEHHLRLAEVRRAFMELPEEQRAALHLVAVEGMSYAEAAAALDVPVGTVMSRISRAREALRALDDAVRPRPPAGGPRLRIVGGADE